MGSALRSTSSPETTTSLHGPSSTITGSIGLAMPSITLRWMAAKFGSQPIAVAIISREDATTPATTRPPG